MIPQHTFTDHFRLREDTLVAARTSSLMCAVFALWFFVSPWAYGYSDYASSWNSWLVGAVMLLCTMARLVSPPRTTIFSYANAVLAVWVFVSPWIFGFAGQAGPRLVNSLSVGVLVLVMSLISAHETRRPKVHL